MMQGEKPKINLQWVNSRVRGLRIAIPGFRIRGMVIEIGLGCLQTAHRRLWACQSNQLVRSVYSEARPVPFSCFSLAMRMSL